MERPAHGGLLPIRYLIILDVNQSANSVGPMRGFLQDPDAKTVRFPLSKPRRQHLHQIINQFECATTHVTDRRGNPQALVCTKTNSSFKQEKSLYDARLKRLNQLKCVRKCLS